MKVNTREITGLVTSFEQKGYDRTSHSNTITAISIRSTDRCNPGVTKVEFPSDPLFDLNIHRAYDKSRPVKIKIEFPVTEVDLVRDLILSGQSKAAAEKALDILERLDK